MASKRELRRKVDAQNDQILRLNHTIAVEKSVARHEREGRTGICNALAETLADRNDLLTILGKTHADLPELRQAAAAIRYADEHEKQMALAGDWA